MIKKILKGIGIVLASIVIVVALLFAGIAVYDPIAYADYYKLAKKEFAIPGLNSNYIPQGLGYSKDSNEFIQTGYNKSSGAAEMYVTDAKTHKSKKLVIKDTEGNIFKGHAGGVAVNGNNVYLSDDAKIYVMNLADIDAAKKGESVSINSSFNVPVNASFCFANETTLIVGEFHRDGTVYIIPETRHTTMSDGSTYHALMVSYNLDNSENGVDENPTEVYAITDNVQGAAITAEGRIVLSCSWGMNSSHLYVYSKTETNGTKTFKGNDETEYTLPIHYLDSKVLEKDVTASPMSEDLEYIDGRVYINNESATNKYIFGKVTSAKNVYSYPVA